MKKFLMVVMATILVLAVAGPAFANEEHSCSHDGTTIESLHHCVEHAAEMGYIMKSGVTDALLAKLDAAQAAYDRGNTTAALKMLNAFINQANAQTGKSIDVEHAGHLIEHAGNVIAALSA